MVNLKNISFKTKIQLSVAGTAFLVVAFVSTIFTLSHYNNAKNALIARIDLETAILSENVSVALLFNDQTTAREIMTGFSADQDILEIILYDNEDNQFSVLANYEQQASETFTILKPVFNEKQAIGKVEVKASLDSVINQRIETFLYALGVVLAASLLSYLIALIFERSLTSPILRLHKLSRRIAETRDYSLRSRISANDEVGQLANMFNKMLSQIQERDKMLEQKVFHRTQDLRKLADKFRHQAYHDSLTGLPNRAMFNDRLQREIELCQLNGQKLACLILDLDDFKTINDTKGHDYGDELLKSVAQRLRKSVRKNDLVCRLGGDEFIILLNNVAEEKDVQIVANTILNKVRKEIIVKSVPIKTGFSIGASIYPDHGNDRVTLKRNADIAMYSVKNTGKNAMSIYSPEMQKDLSHKIMIQNELSLAIKNEELVVNYQPKIHTQTGRVDGCEVLIRWQHPTKGLLSPINFIPYAEESNLIIELDYYVIKKSCEAISNWNNQLETPIKIAVNLSGRHFYDFKIVNFLRLMIKKYNINPSLLEIEITEAVLITDPELAKNILNSIKLLGVKLSLDDFGTGYSSLNYLRTLPIDCIKLDRNFIQNIDTSKTDRQMVKGIIELSKGLNLELVAEGVEKESQLKILRDLGCDYIQGYYYLRPSSEEDFLAWYGEYFLSSLNVFSLQ